MPKFYYAILLVFHEVDGKIFHREFVDIRNDLSEAKELLKQYQEGKLRYNSKFTTTLFNFPEYILVSISKDVDYRFPTNSEEELLDDYRSLNSVAQKYVQGTIKTLLASSGVEQNSNKNIL